MSRIIEIEITIVKNIILNIEAEIKNILSLKIKKVKNI